MPQQKKNTIVFKQTVSNTAYKKLYKIAEDRGCTVQDIIRELIYREIEKTPLK